MHQFGVEFPDFHHATRTRLVSHSLREHISAADALADAGADGHTLEQFDWPTIRDLWASCAFLMVPPAAILLVTLGLAVLFGSLLSCLMVRMLHGAVLLRPQPICLGMLSNNAAEMYCLLIARILPLKFLQAVRMGDYQCNSPPV